MPSPRVVPDHVWAQLDPRAGRLSRRERRIGLALGAAVLIALALAITGYFSGVAYPRINGDMSTANGRPAVHQLDLHVRLINPGWVDQHIATTTIENSHYTVLAAHPSSFVLAPGARRTVRLRIAVRDCSSITENDVLPVTVVVDHWWGHESNVLFTDHGNSGYVGVGRSACHGI